MTIRVLLVDDDEDLLTVASKFLGKEDPTFEIVIASSAEIALESSIRDPFDVIVSDYEMPHGMSGLEYLEIVRKSNPDIPFIIFPGRGREEVAIKALNLGADFYITKGDEPKILYAELAHTIRTVVRHRRAQLALEESDSRFRASFENAAIGMAIVSVDLELIQVNDALCRILEYEELELLSHNLEDFIHPDDVGKAPEMALSQLRGDASGPTYEWRFLSKGGQVIWTRTTSSLTNDAKGTPLYFVSQIQDITEAKITTEALLDSEVRFRGAFHNASVGMALISFRDNIVDCNQALCQMLGYSMEELTQMTFEEITHPDDVEKTPQVVDGTFESGKSTIQLEKKYFHKSGHIVYSFISSSIGYSEEGEPLYYITQFQDITEAKLASHALATSEANYRNLVENSIQNYAIIQGGCYAYVNEPFANTIGLSRKEVLNLNPNQIWELVHPDDIDELKMRNDALERGDEIAPRHEFRYVRRDGSVRWVEGHLRLAEYNGRPAHQIVEIDITERRISELALQGSLDFLDTLINTISSPVFYKDLNGKYQRCNIAFANKLIGISVDEVKGSTSDLLLERIHGLTKKDLIKLDKELLEGGPDQSFEITIEDPHGILRDYQVNRTCFKEQKGKPSGIVGVLL
ncbi:MAG: PAS domain S-box protein, partial [Candidatus Thorarchaeota archaeon]|nr:PAS domain S-box protein [Candidatus Thorarchaeota archaeon]